MKESLQPDVLQFIATKEGTDVFDVAQIADLADLYVNNQIGQYNLDKRNRSEGLNGIQKGRHDHSGLQGNSGNMITYFGKLQAYNAKPENKWDEKKKWGMNPMNQHKEV